MVSAAHRGRLTERSRGGRGETDGVDPSAETRDDPTLHYCVAAYSSDFALLETSLLPHRQTIPSPQIQAASLDHSMWFHAPFRADEWLLYVMTSPAASGGRGLTFGRLYNRSGTLVCTVAQEGLIRKLNTGQGMKRGFQSRSKL